MPLFGHEYDEYGPGDARWMLTGEGRLYDLYGYIDLY